jgi:glycerol-3-phosphate dehydrogenase
MTEFDLAIIGGGINGAGLARDAAGRGLRVLLVETNDLGSGTSSRSSKLIHGGLRYLEHGSFRLVREALTEREVLLRIAPHLIRPLCIVLPPISGGRSALLLRFGLLLYDILGVRKKLPRSRTLDLERHAAGVPLEPQFRCGFEYSDCVVDDARLVVLTALDAAERGAVVRPRTRCVRAERRPDWKLVLDRGSGREVVTTRVLVNAAGPWIGEVAETVIRCPLAVPVRLVKGSHIVVPKRLAHDGGYLLQAADGRVVFVLPFAQDFTLIGTTDEDFTGDLSAPKPDADEVRYLCETVNTYFREKLTPEEAVWSFAGVRALYDDGHGKPEDVTRDYVLALDAPGNEAPLLTVYGGKITTYRRLAEAAMARLGRFFEPRPPWTAEAPLPGGEFAPEKFDDLVASTIARWPFLSEPHARRLLRAYGRRTERILGGARSLDDLGERFTGDLTVAEVRYLVEHEWARTAEDVLWRRSKLGLRATPEQVMALDRFIATVAGDRHCPPPSSP